MAHLVAECRAAAMARPEQQVHVTFTDLESGAVPPARPATADDAASSDDPAKPTADRQAP